MSYKWIEKISNPEKDKKFSTVIIKISVGLTQVIYSFSEDKGPSINYVVSVGGGKP